MALSALASLVSAGPLLHPEVHELAARANTSVDPNAVRGTVCTSPGTKLVTHDINVAILGICGGIAGTIQKCGGRPASTTGQSGTAKLALKPVNAGALLNVSKGRWEGCMRAAQAVCGSSPFTSTCVGGTTNGDFKFTLTKA
ncbi:hypothetical protein EXIGLDRAFT_699721 [Exidia glandulosa HHB12029]|uniref:Uncharacterized protein n=1 Tax=Exidia glandulosa HHB12029 TaxID=1314781 RepID=A0A165DRR6_EXIGL|nr:hypothetical protein EXIGLDRAFT_699721 [Exidia glandulosa HHB12029]